MNRSHRVIWPRHANAHGRYARAKLFIFAYKFNRSAEIACWRTSCCCQVCFFRDVILNFQTGGCRAPSPSPLSCTCRACTFKSDAFTSITKTTRERIDFARIGNASFDNVARFSRNGFRFSSNGPAKTLRWRSAVLQAVRESRAIGRAPRGREIRICRSSSGVVGAFSRSRWKRWRASRIERSRSLPIA